MIIVDTNVISELMRAKPIRKSWPGSRRSRARSSIRPTSIKSENCYGIAVLPDGRRRDALKAAADGMFAEDFASRLLPFGASAATRYAEIMLSRRRIGKPIEGFDALIAAIALATGATVATRDVGGFSDCGLAIVDPWAAL